MGSYDDIRPMPGISPARPWSKELPRRKPVSDSTGKSPGHPLKDRQKKPDDGRPHIDEYA